MNDEIKTIETIPPFTRFCMTIGQLPTSYLMSMTYYEQLVWLTKYLQDNVIPAVNNNAQALKELQEYVAHYFDNLDVQEEINNKLDAMVEDGTFDEIINQELFGQLNADVSALQRNAIYIGNSYTEGTGSTGGHTGLYALTKDMFHNAYKYVTSGGGFLRYDEEHQISFEDLLDDAIADTSFDNDTITDIIVIGAWGESREIAILGRSSFLSNISTAMSSFVTKVKNNFTNAVNIKYVWAESRNVHNHTNNDVVNKWNNMFDIHNVMKDYCPLCGIEYCGWIGFNTLMNAGYFSNDNIHPSDVGYKKLATCFREAYQGNLTYSTYYQYVNTQNEIDTGSYVRGFVMLYPDHATLTINRVYIKNGTTPNVNATFKFIDFNGVNYAIPQAFGYDLNVGFINIATESTLDPSNGLILMLTLAIDNNEPYIKATAKNQKVVGVSIDYAPTSCNLFDFTFASR